MQIDWSDLDQARDTYGFTQGEWLQAEKTRNPAKFRVRLYIEGESYEFAIVEAPYTPENIQTALTLAKLRYGLETPDAN